MKVRDQIAWIKANVDSENGISCDAATVARFNLECGCSESVLRMRLFELYEEGYFTRRERVRVKSNAKWVYFHD